MLALDMRILTTATLCVTGWCDAKERYWLVCVVFWYIDVVMVPSESWHSSTSRKGSILSSDPFSTVNCIRGSILFMGLWKDLTMSLGRSVEVSST